MIYICKKLLITYSIFVCFSLSANQPKHSVGWELWYPYQYHNENHQLVGLDFDIFNAIMKEADISVNYTELPWKRHLNYIKTGYMDMAMGASFTKSRADYAFYSLPYRKETVKLYVKKGKAQHIKLTSLKDLITTPYLIGVEGGYFYGKEYQALIKNAEFRAQINEVIDIEENVQLLLKGHIDGFLVDPATIAAFVTKYQMQDEFEQHDIEIYSDDIYIMLSKKTTNSALLDKINSAITTLKRKGKLTEIIKNWSQLQGSNKL